MNYPQHYTSFRYDQEKRIPSSWNVTKLLRRGPLTDRQIAEYQRQGWYSEAFKRARRELQEKQQKRPGRREGNFLNVNGRLVYSPLL